MKKPLPAPLVAVIATVSAVVVLGIGFMYFSKATAPDTPTKQEEVERYNKAKAFYQERGMSAQPNPEADMRAKYPGGKPAGK